LENIVNKINFEQWNGLSEKYHNDRPIPPEVITTIIMSWLQKKPETVVDVGSGTGLSTVIWNDIANKIIGIEPNDDMRDTAKKNNDHAHIDFKKGLANDTGLPSVFADVITVSQAFHWMDIDSTLSEFYRLLKPDGVLAIYDFIMPPVVNWEVEMASSTLREVFSDIVYSQETPPVHNDKSTYNDRIVSFGKFRCSRRVEFHKTEIMTPEKIATFLICISNAYFAIQTDPSLRKRVNDFFDFVTCKINGEVEVIIPYQMIIAVK